MASSAMVRVTGGARSGGRGVRDLNDHLAAIVISARLADVVRQLEFATVRALTQVDGAQPMMRSPHVALGFRHLSFRYGHSSNLVRRGCGHRACFSCNRRNAANGPSKR